MQAGEKELPFDVKGVFEKEVHSTIHRKLSMEFKRLLGDKYSVCNEYIEKLVEMQREFLVEIERDYKFASRTLLGFHVNFAVTGVSTAVYIGILFYGYFNIFSEHI